MIYFGNHTSNPVVHDAIRAGRLGYIDTPGKSGKIGRQIRDHPGVKWCADNGCFGASFDEAKWWRFLVEAAGSADRCLFATAPDVVGDAAATLDRSRPWLSKIRELGYPAAFVAQDGIENTDVPWDEFDCLFIGGSDEFKVSPVALKCAVEAKRRGKWLHMGRVNGLKRFRYAEAIGSDSVDGTKLTFDPAGSLRYVLSWIDDLDLRPGLFGLSS